MLGNPCVSSLLNGVYIEGIPKDIIISIQAGK